MKALKLTIICLTMLACQNKIHKADSIDKIIDTTGISYVSVFCNNFYNEIDNALFAYNTQVHISKPLHLVMEIQQPYWIISNRDSLEKIKKIFFKDYKVADSIENNRKKIGDYFLLIKNGNETNTLSYSIDSVWIYNQKYTLKYKTNPMHELLKLQKAKGVDCFTCDSIKIIVE